MAPLGKRYAALLEVCLVSLLLTFVVWLREAYLAYLKCSMLWHFGFPAFMMLIALLAITLPKRSFRIYGFLPRSPRLLVRSICLYNHADKKLVYPCIVCEFGVEGGANYVALLSGYYNVP